MAQQGSQDTLKQRLMAGAHRLRLNDALRAASWAGLGALGAMALVILAQRLFFLGQPVELPVVGRPLLPGWGMWTLLGLLLVPVAAGAVAYALSRKGTLTAAMAVDRRLGLRARLSSAVVMDQACRRSPMAAHLEADAHRHAKAIKVARDFPLKTPRGALFLPFGLFLLTVTMLAIPQVDVLGREKKDKEKDEARADIKLVVEEIEKRLQDALKRTPPTERSKKNIPSNKLKNDLSKLVKDLKEASDREDAIAKLNRVMDKAKLMEARIAAMAEMMRQMEKLKKQGAKADLPKGLTSAMAKAMTAGDFKKAAAEMKKLKDMLEKDQGLSDAQKAALKRELDKLAKMTDDWKELADKLRKAGDELGEDDKAALAAMQQAMKDLEELAELLKELGLEGGEEGFEGLQEEGQQIKLTKEMIQQLKDMLKNAQKCTVCKRLYCLVCGKPRCGCEALEQCAGHPKGQGMGMGLRIPGGATGTPGAGGAPGDGKGMGGYGQGKGGKAPETEHDVKFQSTKVKGQLGQGRIISHMFVKGRPSVTDEEKKNEYKAAHAAAAKAASAEVDSGRIPRDLRDYVRNYFKDSAPKKK